MTSLQKGIRYTLYTFLAIWGIFLVPDVLGLKITNSLEHINGNLEYVKGGWYGIPYIITSIALLGFLVSTSIKNFIAHSEGK